MDTMKNLKNLVLNTPIFDKEDYEFAMELINKLSPEELEDDWIGIIKNSDPSLMISSMDIAKEFLEEISKEEYEEYEELEEYYQGKMPWCYDGYE